MSKMIVVEHIERKIYFMRGIKVMFDKDLAALYGVSTKRLNEQVRRNIKRFPDDFMFRLTLEEMKILRSQNATLEMGQYSKFRALAFTEQGIAMLSSVLNSERAIEINIAIMRIFVRIREVLAQHKEINERLRELEHRMDKTDQKIIALFEEIRKLMAPPPVKKKPFIGFHPQENSIYPSNRFPQKN